MQLNIKDADTVRPARQLAKATGRLVTQAIKQALEGALRRREEIRATTRRRGEIARECREGLPDELRRMTSRKWMDGICDDEGLPVSVEQAALAKTTGEPLLFKGDGFVHADIAAA